MWGEAPSGPCVGGVGGRGHLLQEPETIPSNYQHRLHLDGLLRSVLRPVPEVVGVSSHPDLPPSASNLGGNPYYNYLLSAAVEVQETSCQDDVKYLDQVPALGFNLLVLDSPWVGRRRALSGGKVSWHYKVMFTPTI